MRLLREVNMTIDEAEEKCQQIDKLADELMADQELADIDFRYYTMASWIDTDVENVSNE